PRPQQGHARAEQLTATHAVGQRLLLLEAPLAPSRQPLQHGDHPRVAMVDDLGEALEPKRCFDAEARAAVELHLRWCSEWKRVLRRVMRREDPVGELVTREPSLVEERPQPPE